MDNIICFDYSWYDILELLSDPYDEYEHQYIDWKPIKEGGYDYY